MSKKYLVTSALPYANGSIHLGHLVEYIQADVWARYHKMKGIDCKFICASDAHGTPVMVKADTLGIKPEVLIDKLKPLISKNLGKNAISSIGIVTGATYPKEVLKIRKKLPFAPFLIPGFGAQGGSLKDAKLGLVSDEPYNNKLNFGIINSSRSLCFPKSAHNCKSIKSWKKEIYCNLENIISNLHN